MKDHIFIRLLLNQSRWKSLILLCILLAASAELLVAFQDFDHSKIMVEGLPGPIEVTHLYFDFSGSEAIPLRENYSTPIPKPEWINDSRSGACLFVQNSTIEISARFESPSDTDSAFIWAEAPVPPGDVEGRWVYFANGVSDPEYYTFSTESPAPDGLGYYTWDWQWKMYSDADGTTRTLNVSGPHELYTILAVPGLPWVLNSGNTRNPWTRALDLVLTEIEAETVEEALDEVTRYCFDRPCFEYDIWSGAPCYISGYWNFNLSLFLQDMENQHDPRIGCCYDGAAIVHTLADLVGAQTHFVWSNPFGYLNCIDPIGRGEDYSNNPFHESSYYRDDPIVYQDGTSSSCGRSSFGNHAFAASQPGMFGVIWDATMCVDVDGNPDTSVKFPPTGGYTSTGLTATTLSDSDQSWTPDQWSGMYLNPNTNENSPDPYREYLIVSNTESVITVEDGSNMTQYADAGDYYWIRDVADPDVDIIRLTGYHWNTYESMTRDNGSAEVPEEISIGLY